MNPDSIIFADIRPTGEIAFNRGPKGVEVHPEDVAREGFITTGTDAPRIIAVLLEAFQRTERPANP